MRYKDIKTGAIISCDSTLLGDWVLVEEETAKREAKAVKTEKAKATKGDKNSQDGTQKAKNSS